MFDGWHNLAFGRTIGAQLVGDHALRWQGHCQLVAPA